MGSTELYFLLVLIVSLVGAGVTYFLKPRFASSMAIMSMVTGFGFSLLLIFSANSWTSRFVWMPNFELGWRLDRVSMLLICLVLFISLLVHIFSLKYMKEEEHPRYFAKLGFFTFSMLGLLAADHLILLFIFWELVGFSSYLLIGFWYKNDEAATSAKWAFMTNRVADVALLAAILGLGVSQTFFLSELSNTVTVWIGFGLLIGAMGKSGQFPFMAWLPRAMTGPTPVSALIHAATMVAAGVYLLLRVAPVLPEIVLTTTVIVGVVTATVGAFSALTQHDIKKVLAYSTVSQLGFMFMSIGAGSVSSAFFHLWTHAFFKAGLFLAAGAVIHQLGTQDMRQMGGLRSKMPLVFGTFLICGLALSGIPLFSGFMSKEGILQAVWQWSEVKYMAGYTEAHLVTIFTFFSVFMTAWYFGRQVWLVFMGEQRNEAIEGTKKVTLIMILPLLFLALGSLWIFHNWNPFSATGFVLNGILIHEEIGHISIVIYLAILVAIMGLIFTYFIYNSKANYAKKYGSKSAPNSMMGRLSYSAIYLDEFCQVIMAPSYLMLSKITAWIDRKIIDALVNSLGVLIVVLSKFSGLVDRLFVDGLIRFIGAMSIIFGDATRRTQSRFLQTQLSWLLLGVILILLYILFLSEI